MEKTQFSERSDGRGKRTIKAIGIEMEGTQCSERSDG
jgi:hypothetical protein